MQKHMRKLVFTLFLIIVGFSNSAISENIEIGISAGVNRTSLAYEKPFDIWSLNKRTLFNLATEIAMPISDHLKFQTGIGYDKVGNQVDVNLPETPGIPTVKYFTITQNYLFVPAQIKLTLVNKPVLYAFSGLEIGYLLSASANSTYTDGLQKSEDIQKTLNKINLNALIGAGIEFKLSELILFIESYYAHGLTNIPKKEGWVVKWQTREFSFNIGIRFKLK